MLLAILVCITAVPLTAVAEMVEKIEPNYDYDLGLDKVQFDGTTDLEDSIFDEEERSEIVELYAAPITISENTGGSWRFNDPDDDGEGDWWYHYYNIYPEEVTVVYDNGTTKTLAPEDDEEISYRLCYDDEQSYENQLHVGENTVKIFLGAAAAEYFVYSTLTVYIEESPVESIYAEPVNFWEHSGGQWRDDYDWENDITYEDAYYEYDLSDYEVNITVNYKDGTSYVGNLGEYRDVYGWESIYFDSEQRTERSFDVGSYERMLALDGFVSTVEINVHESPVESVSASDIEIWQYTDGMFRDEYDYETGETIENAWYYYFVYPDHITVEFKSGEVYEGSYFSFFEKYNQVFDFGCTYKMLEDQSYENPWGVGSHTAGLELMGAECEFNVEIIESPIVDIEVNDIYCIENWDGCLAWGYGPNGEYYGSYWNYEERPDEITVHFRDGSSMTGTLDEIGEKLGLGAYVSTSQSPFNPYVVGGVYECTVDIGSFEKTYKVHIIESPVESFTAYDRDLYYEMDGNWSGTLDEETGEFVPESFYYELSTAFDILMKDGTFYEGVTDEEIIEIFGEAVEYDLDEPQWVKPWGMGANEVVARFLGATCPMTFNVIESYANLYAPDSQVIEMFDGYYVTDGDSGEVYWEYETWPEYVVLTLKNGEVYRGTTSEIEEAIGGWFGMSITQWPGHTWDELGVYECRITYHADDGADYTAYFNVEVVETPVASVSVSDVSHAIGSNGWYEGDFDDETGEYLGSFFKYDNTPETYTVTMKDGTVYENYSYDELSEIFGEFIRVEDDQGYYNQWGAGMHTAYASLLGYRFEFPVEITESNVEYIMLLDDGIIPEYSYEFGDWMWGEEEGKWYYYDLSALRFEIGFKNGDTFEGDVWDISNQFDESFMVRTGQSYENQWGIGTHTFEVSFMGKTDRFEIEIVDAGIDRFEIKDIEFVEGECLEYCEDEYGNGWYQYDCAPSEITVYFDDGETYTGDFYDVRWNLDIYLELETDQSRDNKWGVGEHTAYLCMGNEKYPYTVTVKEFPVARIEVADRELIENCDGWYEGYWDDETGEYIPNAWFNYDAEPKTVTVYYKDGTSETLTFYELLEIFGYENTDYYFDDEQTYEDQWQVGESYRCTLEFFGLEAEYTVTVVETPVSDIDVFEFELMENWDGGFAYSYTPDGAVEWFCYDYLLGEDDIFTVTMKDGSVIRGNAEEIFEKTGDWISINIDQNYDDQCTVGVNTATVSLLGFEKSVEFNLKENPVAEIELEKVPTKTEYSEIEDVDLRGAVIKITYKDGTVERFEIKDYCYDSVKLYSEYMDGEFVFDYYDMVETDEDVYVYQMSEWHLGCVLEFEVQVIKKLADLEVYTGEDGFGYCNYIFNDGTSKTVKLEYVHFSLFNLYEGQLEIIMSIVAEDGVYMLIFYLGENGELIFGMFSSDVEDLIACELEGDPAWFLNMITAYSFTEASTVIDEAIGLMGFNGTVTKNNIDELVLLTYYTGMNSYQIMSDLWDRGEVFVISASEAEELIFRSTGQIASATVSKYYDAESGNLVIPASSEFMTEFLRGRTVIKTAVSGDKWNFTVEYSIYNGAEERLTMNIIIDGEGHVKKYFEGEGVRGDLTGDGSINITDLFAMKSCLAKGTDNPSADINGDGSINITDMFMLKQILVG